MRRHQHRRTILILTLAMPLAPLGTSCATHLNRASAIRYSRNGLQALASNHLLAAHESYRRALVNVELADLGPVIHSTAQYHLARATGALCQHQEAKRLLKLSLGELEPLEDSPEITAYRSQHLFTLGNLAYDRGLYEEAASYYRLAVPLADELEAEESDPLHFARALDLYGEALGHAGQQVAAEEVLKRAADMRKAAPATAPIGGRLCYNGFDNAKEQLLVDLRRAEAEEGPKGPTATTRLLWLGVLESNRNNHEAALAYFERGLRTMGDAASGGESMAIVLDRYAHVLRASGRDAEAQAIEAKAAALRKK